MSVLCVTLDLAFRHRFFRAVICSINSAKLDYSSSIVYGITHEIINKLQCVQHSLARRLVTGTTECDHHLQSLPKSTD